MGFFCVPAHVGVLGNEEADKTANRAINRKESDLEILYGRAECKALIQQGIAKLWQKEWNEGKLRQVLLFNTANTNTETHSKRKNGQEGHCGDN